MKSFGFCAGGDAPVFLLIGNSFFQLRFQLSNVWEGEIGVEISAILTMFPEILQ